MLEPNLIKRGTDQDPLGSKFYDFHAFQDTSAFVRVLIRGPGISDGRVMMDNLRFVPEPNTAALLAVGLFGIFFLSQRRHTDIRC